MAAVHCVEPDARHRDRPDRNGAGRRGGQSLVRRPQGPGHRRADGQFGHRAARLFAAGYLDDRTLGWRSAVVPVLFGSTLIALLCLLPTVKLAGAEFGPQKAGMIFGWAFAAHQLGAATAAYGAGFARTLLLTYRPALYTAGAACLIAAVMVTMIRRPAAQARGLGIPVALRG